MNVSDLIILVVYLILVKSFTGKQFVDYIVIPNSNTAIRNQINIQQAKMDLLALVTRNTHRNTAQIFSNVGLYEFGGKKLTRFQFIFQFSSQTEFLLYTKKS
jgi:hypothetical protein